MSTFKERLEAYIKPKGFTIEQVAKLAGVSAYQLGKDNPTFSDSNWRAICQVLGVKQNLQFSPCSLPEPGQGQVEDTSELSVCNSFMVPEVLDLDESLSIENWKDGWHLVKEGNRVDIGERKARLEKNTFRTEMLLHLREGFLVEAMIPIWDKVKDWKRHTDQQCVLSLNPWAIMRDGELLHDGNHYAFLSVDQVIPTCELIAKAQRDAAVKTKEQIERSRVLEIINAPRDLNDEGECSSCAPRDEE